MNLPLSSVFDVDKPSFEVVGSVNHFWCIHYDNTGSGNPNKSKQTNNNKNKINKQRQTKKNKKKKEKASPPRKSIEPIDGWMIFLHIYTTRQFFKAAKLVGSCIKKEKKEVNF